MKNQYKICGDETILYIKRRDGELYEALIDTVDLDKLISFGSTWSFEKGDRDSFYIHANHKGEDVKLHRFLMDAPKDKVVDHINGNPQDNKQSNMRLVTHAENMQNRKVHASSKSGVRGVRYHEKEKKWRAEITINKKYKCIGNFESKELTEEAVTKARKNQMPFSADALPA